MIRSMTAFAREERRDPLGELVWEIRSVNHRFLETFVRLPDDFRVLETAVRERAARSGRNPKTGETITIEASRVAGFKAGKALKDALN